jgi:hypothetical protein
MPKGLVGGVLISKFLALQKCIDFPLVRWEDWNHGIR